MPTLVHSALISLVAAMLVLVPVTVSHAQGIPVYDNANWLANIVTSTQAVFIVANQLLELLPLDEFLAMDGFVEDIEEIREALSNLRGLGWDLNSLDSQFERLFGLGNIPETAEILGDWQWEVHALALEARHDAARVQTLIRTLRRTFDHLLGLMESVANMIGNLQISQTISQAQQKVAQLLSEQQLTRTVHERAETIQKTIDLGETVALKKINCGIWRNWPGMACE